MTGRGVSIRKGERSSTVVFWKQHATKDRDTGLVVAIPVLRHHSVFDSEQCEGITSPDAVRIAPSDLPFEPIAQAGGIVESYRNRPVIQHGRSGAFHRPLLEQVHIAQPERCVSRESCYATLFQKL